MAVNETYVKDWDGLRAKHDLALILYANQDKVYFDPAFTKFD